VPHQGIERARCFSTTDSKKVATRDSRASRHLPSHRRGAAETRLDLQKLLWRAQVQASGHHSQARAGAERMPGAAWEERLNRLGRPSAHLPCAATDLSAEATRPP
jgi:hypothetical protein